jgi:D-alanyl-D-alanine carboxypeptidase
MSIFLRLPQSSRDRDMDPISRHRYFVTFSQTLATGWLLSFATFAALAFSGLSLGSALAGPVLVVDSQSGSVLYEEQAMEPWYPASVTKLMTTYVALSAVRDHRIALDTPLAVSARAASMAPSKMGFRPGTLVTLDNALKMLMVKSANDMAVTIAEGVSGSVEAFADDMNETARSLGMTQSHFVNPNGLPNPDHISSARDLAILALAVYHNFPEHAELFNIGALRFAGKVIRNHNDLLGRYPGADGMKTGFICASGFNIVASATQGGRKFIVVVLGAPNPRSRAMMASTLFDRAFAGIDRPSKSLSDLTAATQVTGQPTPGTQQSFCGRRGKAAAAFNAQAERLLAPLVAPKTSATSSHYVLTTTEGLARPAPVATRIAMVPAPAFDPVPVYVGPSPGYGGLVAQARPPHSPVGTPQPPGTATAYAPETPDNALAASPVAPDAAALQMKGRTKYKSAQLRQHGSRRHRVARAEAREPHKLHKAPQNPAKTAHGAVTKRKKQVSAKLDVKAHSKIGASHSAVAKAQASPGGRAAKTKGQIVKMQANR